MSNTFPALETQTSVLTDPIFDEEAAKAEKAERIAQLERAENELATLY